MNAQNTNTTQQKTKARNSGLTDALCRNAKCPADKKRLRMFDGGGLYLEVDGKSKRWFYKFHRIDGKESRLSIGHYPSTSLKDARFARHDAALKKSQGIDPVTARKQKKILALSAIETTFANVATKWVETKKVRWSESHLTREQRNISKDLLPMLGTFEVSKITPPLVFSALKKVEGRGAFETAHRVWSTANQIFRFAKSLGMVDNVCTDTLKENLQKPTRRHFAAIIKPVEFGDLMLAMDSYRGSEIVQIALMLAPLLFQRPTELRAAEWCEFDFKEKLWSIPSMRMKRDKDDKETGEPHLVPLSSQAIALLNRLHEITGDGKLLFPSLKSPQRPISDNTMRTGLFSLGYEKKTQSVHGFRASARTMIDEKLHIDARYIELQLAHAVKDANGRAYNRAEHMEKRAEMMQAWSDYVYELKSSAAQKFITNVA